MRRCAAFMILILVVLFALPAVAQTETPQPEQKAPAAAPKPKEVRMVSLDANYKLAGEALSAGDYLMRHEMEGEDHVMYFKRVGKNGPEVRVICQMVKLDRPAEYSELRYTTLPNGDRLLSAIIVKGDAIKHVF
jgi:hypothetical protein